MKPVLKYAFTKAYFPKRFFYFLLCLLATLKADWNQQNLALNKNTSSEIGSTGIYVKLGNLGVDGNNETVAVILKSPIYPYVWYYVDLGELYHIERIQINVKKGLPSSKSSPKISTRVIKISAGNMVFGIYLATILDTNNYTFGGMTECKISDKIIYHENVSCPSSNASRYVVLKSKKSFHLREIEAYGKTDTVSTMTTTTTTITTKTRTTTESTTTISYLNVTKSEEEKKKEKIFFYQKVGLIGVVILCGISMFCCCVRQIKKLRYSNMIPNRAQYQDESESSFQNFQTKIRALLDQHSQSNESKKDKTKSSSSVPTKKKEKKKQSKKKKKKSKNKL